MGDITIDRSAMDAYIAAHSVEDGDCIRWTGYCFNGHPGMTLAGKKMLVRRALWLAAGLEIPKGKVLRCTCETALCINLAHCEPMTHKRIALIEGATGAMSGPLRSAKIAAAKRAGKQAKITQDDARAIRASDETITVLGERYGLNPGTVAKIKRGECRRDFGRNPFEGLGA